MTDLSGDDQVAVPSSMSFSRLAAIEAVVDRMFESLLDSDQLGFYEDGLESDGEIEIARELIAMLYSHLWDDWNTLAENPLQDSLDTHW